ncbi:hypothetical protein PMI26_02894 [Pseudomonas sp. GM33]|jgi:hypothetical protein|uniref:hypothetical protein n=1 Tax=Pseudomonas sp. GM33 TaxID=1144329 RepID=UPI00027012CF|nr:hypothetical protein [Pseudomonas sp. GM33]EJM42739.1 hypothetical protein PMI26_02894 [Pseudomonas sp. GM33]
MWDTDFTQSFTAQLFVDDMPVSSAHWVVLKLLVDPKNGEREGEEWLELHRKLLSDLIDNGMMSYGEGVLPYIFYFEYHDDVYTIRIKGDTGWFNKTASMEGESRSLSEFKGDDPTYFRIINSSGDVVKLDEIPDAISDVYLETGPQRRSVKTYSGYPTFPVLTDDPRRSGKPVLFKLKIIDRHPS